MPLAPQLYLPAPKTIYVDGTNGGTNGVHGRVDRPFSTYALAKAAALPGDTIHVRPGQYTVAMEMPSYTRTIAAAGSSGLVRSSGTVTCTTTASQAIPVGTRVRVSGATDAAFDGVFTVLSSSGTTLTWKQGGGSATSGGGTLAAAFYLHLEDGVTVDVSSGNAALWTTSATFCVVTGNGTLRGQNIHGVRVNANDVRLELTCREVASTGTTDGIAGLRVDGTRTVLVYDVAARISSDAYDGLLIEGAAQAIGYCPVMEGGDQAIELATTQGCQIEFDDAFVVGDRWGTFGGFADQPVVSVATPASGQTTVIRGKTVRYTSVGDAKGLGYGFMPVENDAGKIIYDVRHTTSSGGAAVFINGPTGSQLTISNAILESTFAGTATGADREGYAVIAGPGRFDGICSFIAASNATTSTYSDSATTLYGGIRINKASHANVTLDNDVEGSGGATDLDDLTDVAISSLASGHVLYSANGTSFVNATADTAGLVAKSGNQTPIAGNKTWTGTQTIVGASNVVHSVINGASGQTADLQQWQNNVSAVLAAITSAGGASFSGNVVLGSGSFFRSTNFSGLGSNQATSLQSNNQNAAGNSLTLCSGTYNGASVAQVAAAITPTYNQTGTSSGTDLLINRTQTAVGSGTHRFVDYQVAGSSKYSVSTGGVPISTSSAPANASATGTAGMITWDADYIYVCTATNTWKRVAIATW